MSRKYIDDKDVRIYKHNPKEIQSKEECYEDFLGYIAELKKKYTEEKE